MSSRKLSIGSFPWVFLILAICCSARLTSVRPKVARSEDNHVGVDIKPRDGGAALRILCLGASITFGVGSTTGNGYRQDLKEMLLDAGNTVHFVGTQTSGNMQNNANEGYPGYRIDQVMGFAWNSYGYLPNVVLVHLGTNDFAQGYDPQTSANLMGTLVDQIFSATPSTFVVVSKLLPNNKTTEEAGIEKFNSLLDGVVSSRVDKGDNVVLVDMHSSEFSVSDLGPDGTHPIDEGYSKMAGVWYDAINTAINSNKIPPLKSNGLSDTDNTNNDICAFTSSSIGRPSTSQFGYGNMTAVFKGAWENKGVVLKDTSTDEIGVFWADFSGGRVDDYVHIAPDGTLSVAANSGEETFGAITSHGKPPECQLSGVRFADMNGDGVSDYICIDVDGSMTAYMTASKDDLSWGSVTMTKATLGQPQAYIFIADMDGDGLGDYISVTSGGTAYVSYNRRDSWTNFYEVFTFPNFNISATRFFDVNGDGRADAINVAYDGTISAWINYRGDLLVYPYFQDSSIIMHPIANANITSNLMTFGKIRGTTKTDLATLHKDGTIKLFENRGYNGIAYGDRCRYCDMTNSGSDSYLSIGESGSLKFFQNIHNGGIHLKYGEILGDQGLAAADVHLADIDGDGKCDYVIVNNQTGALQWRKNQGVITSGTTGSLTLADPVSLSLTNSPGCDSGGVRFADLDGDGNADYICILNPGDVFVGINSGNGFSVSSSLFSVADDILIAGSRDAISFADIDGDGYADYLFFDTGTGSVTARLNTGKGQTFGSAQKIYSDNSFVDGFLRFANMNGLGRADMININPLSAKAKTSSNRCPNPVPPTGIGPNPNPPDGSNPVIVITTTLPGGSVITTTSTEFPSSESGVVTTLSSGTSSSTTIPGGFLWPVTTSVQAPKSSDGGTVIPCNLWFFFICIRWGDINVQGWEFNLPPGTYPPGPPPPITIGPEHSITFSVSGTLPDWPAITIGPDRLPTYTAKPTNGPDDGCETETAELCATSTSYGVSISGAATITTASQAVSTCATIYGCNVEDSSTANSVTSGCTSASPVTDITYVVSFQTDSDGSTTATSTISTESTITQGCSVTPETVTSTVVSSCAASGCACFSWSYDDGIDWTSVGDGDPLADPDDAVILPAARKVRRDPGKTATTMITKPAETIKLKVLSPETTAPPFSNLALPKRTLTDRRKSTKFGDCQLNTAMTLQPYPEVSDYPNFPAASSYFVLSARSTDDGTCYAGYMYSTSDLAQASKTVGGPTYATGPAKTPTPVVNTDHVYENSLLGSFFADVLKLQGAPTCDQFNAIYVDTGLLQQVFDNLANINHPDFMAMDRYVNLVKANYFSPNGNPPSLAAPKYSMIINEIQQYGMVAQLLMFQETIELFRRTHQRLYQVFGTWDQGLEGCNEPGVSATWADTYSKWMTGFLSSRATVYTSAASSWYSILSSAPPQDPVPTFTQFAATFPVNSFSIPVAALASGLQPAPAVAGKRQAACTLTGTTQTASLTSKPLSTASSSISSLSNPPTLTSGISTPSGSSCVATGLQTDCAIGPGGAGTACVTSSTCASWVATGTTETATSAAATPTGSVYIDIYTDSGCLKLLEQTVLNDVEDCYSPTDSNGDPITFKCFALTYVSDKVKDTLSLAAFKDGDCFSQDDSGIQKYDDLSAIDDDNEKPFKMGSLNLFEKGT